jgi:hypothetical protein
LIYLWVFLSVGMAQAGDWLLRNARGAGQCFYAGAIVYALSAFPVWKAYRYGTWFEVALLWELMAIVLSIFTGSVIIGEKLALHRWFAFALAGVAALLWYSGPE